MSDPTAVAHQARHGFLERVVGALRLDAATYDEVEHDESALGQAAGVVVLGILATAIGTSGAGIEGSVVGASLGALLGWFVSALFVWFVGVQWMDHTSDLSELLRTLGFASAPQLVLVLAILPLVGPIIALAVIVWGLAAYLIAVREALDVTTGRAALVCVLAFGLKLVTAAVLGTLAALVGAG